jgi:hypothetical protein
MKGRVAQTGLLVLAVALTVAFGARLRHEPKKDPLPPDSAISSVIRTLNAYDGTHWRLTGGDPGGTIDLRDSYDYRNGTARPVKDPFLATMKIRPRDTEGFLYTADISAGNYRTQRTRPFTESIPAGKHRTPRTTLFAQSRLRDVCVDFDDTGEVLTRKHDLPTYRC